MEPPIPLPEGETCPRCGALILETRRHFCPQCGASLKPDAPGLTFVKILGAGCLGLIGLASGGMGACFLLFSGFGSKPDWSMVGIALGMLLVGALCIWGIVKLVKR